jgi:hypothetical protein
MCVRLLPLWFIQTMAANQPAFPTLIEAAEALDDWGLSANIQYYHDMEVAAVLKPEVGYLASRRVMSWAPFLHNEGDRHKRMKRSLQMDAWYALTRFSRFGPG